MRPCSNGFVRTGSALAVVLPGLLLLWGCGQELYEVEEAPDLAEEALDEAPPPLELAGVPTATVQRFTGPGGEAFEVTLRTPGRTSHLHARIGPESYPLPLRTGQVALSSYPCASCHAGLTVSSQAPREAHDDIRPTHPSESGHLCTTCHVADSVERLVLLSGDEVALDHAYRLCAQCHSSETRSWAAGVHGKRLEGWHGRRVVLNCADCHDPHTPTLEQRIPYPGPRIPRRAGPEP